MAQETRGDGVPVFRTSPRVLRSRKTGNCFRLYPISLLGHLVSVPGRAKRNSADARADAVGVAMEAELLAELDALALARGCTRSELLRDLARTEVARSTSRERVPAVAAVTLVYNHHVRLLSERLTSIQHELGESVRSTMHVHLDEGQLPRSGRAAWTLRPAARRRRADARHARGEPRQRGARNREGAESSPATISVSDSAGAI
jgi:hypothetical protein